MAGSGGEIDCPDKTMMLAPLSEVRGELRDAKIDIVCEWASVPPEEMRGGVRRGSAVEEDGGSDRVR